MVLGNTIIDWLLVVVVLVVVVYDMGTSGRVLGSGFSACRGAIEEVD